MARPLESLSRFWFGDLKKQYIELEARSNEDLEVHRRGSEKLKNIVNWGSLVTVVAAAGVGIVTQSLVDSCLAVAISFANIRADDQIEKRIISINRVLERRRQDIMKSVSLTPLQGV